MRRRYLVQVVVVGLLLLPLGWLSPAVSAAEGVHQGQARRLYLAYFLREPDAGGLRYWVGQLDSGTALTAVSSSFAAAPEFKNTYGALSDPDFVDLVYRNVMRRPPDQGGHAFWVARLANRQATRGGLMVGFSESPEFVRRTTPQAPPLGNVAVRQTPGIPQIHDNADPAVLVEGGRTYLFGSTNNMKLPVREIRDFNVTLAASRMEWDQAPRDAMPSRPAWVDRSDWQIWAPSAVRIGSTYYLYFAAPRGGVVEPVNDQCIGRAAATTPMGPYTPEVAPLYCGLPARAGTNPWGRGALDPDVLRAADGRLYLLMALSLTRGNIAVVALAADGTVPGGPNAAPTVLVNQELPYHDGTDDGSLSPSAFMENPSMVYEPSTRTYLLFYSAGHWPSSNYNTGAARCLTPMGPCRLDGRGPFLVSDGLRSGPGGLSVFRDAAGSLRVAYATWKTGLEGGSPDPTGQLARHTHFRLLDVSNDRDPSVQTVRLR
ncbi:MAG: DUF4214 domain-containing protein [Aquihabitans sp.]